MKINSARLNLKTGEVNPSADATEHDIMTQGQQEPIRSPLGSFTNTDASQRVDNQTGLFSQPELDPTPGQLNLDQFLIPVGTRKVETDGQQLEIPVKMPGAGGKQPVFFMVHPEFRIQVCLLELDDGEYRTDKPFLVAKAVAEKVDDSLIKTRLLYLAQSIQGMLYLIPVAANSDDGWTRSKLTIIEQAKSKWVRAVSKKEAGAYNIKFMETTPPSVDWSKVDADPQKLMQTAFGGRIIVDLGQSCG